MSILIKGMEMPQNCYECKFGLATFYRLYTQDSKGKANCYSCVLTGKQITSMKRNIHCPLVPVPPHGRWNNIIQGIIPSGQCSNCGAWDKVTRFCPNCGSQMEGE